MLKGVSFSLNLKNVLYSRPEHLNQQYAAVILKAINHELIDCNRVEAVQEGKRLCVCLPWCQRRLHALRQGAGGGGFIELMLWSGQRSQHAHCNSTNIMMNIKHRPANRAQTHIITAEQHKVNELVLLSGVA